MNHKDYTCLYSNLPDLPPLLALSPRDLMHRTEDAVPGTVLMTPADTIMHHSEAPSRFSSPLHCPRDVMSQNCTFSYPPGDETK